MNYYRCYIRRCRLIEWKIKRMNRRAKGMTLKDTVNQISRTKFQEALAKNLMEQFFKNPCIETARPAYIHFNKSKTPFPTELVNFIADHFEKEHNAMVNMHLKKIKAESETVVREKVLLLSCALQSNNLETAYKQYKELTNVKNVNNSALRMRLDRYLEEEISSYLSTQFPKNHPPKPQEPIPSPPQTVPKKLSDKIRFYREWICEDNI